MWLQLCLCSVIFSILNFIPVSSGRLNCHSDSNRKIFIQNGLEVNLTNCGLLQLNVSNLVNRSNLEIINASRNQISILNNNTFFEADSLVVADVSHNHVKIIELDTFDSLTNLSEIYLNNNAIAELEVGIFDELANLKILHLQHNEIIILEENLFSKNEILQVLLLGHNKIVAIGPTVFKQLNALETLDLKENICIDDEFKKYEEQILTRFTQILNSQPTVKYSNCLQSYPVYLKLTKQYSKLAVIESPKTFNKCPKNQAIKEENLIERLFSGEHLYVLPTIFFVISFVINIILCVCFFYMFKDDHTPEHKSTFRKIDPNFDPGRRVSIRPPLDSSNSDSDDEKTDEKSETEKLNKKNMRTIQRRVSFDERFIRKNHKDLLGKDVTITLPTTPE
jgi:hypothetical protein